MCGGSSDSRWAGKANRGLSPRVRGKRGHCVLYPSVSGSIPACAGEARYNRRKTAQTKVYPRVCGGSIGVVNGVHNGVGLSPRVRGKPIVPANETPAARSIPACAGEARIASGCRTGISVYPRVCGGSWAAHHISAPRAGLSPRVRGKPVPARCPYPARRSIPACAGEAQTRPGRPILAEVYPRVCGGSVTASTRTIWPSGLSPRVRGKLLGIVETKDGVGSIPACAGEARVSYCASTRRPVYPRVCGGSDFAAAPRQGQDGLSPRVRGKR